MRKNWMTLVVAGFLTAGLADSAQAQEVPTIEIVGGYNALAHRADLDTNFPRGWFAGAGWNMTDRLAIVGEISGGRETQEIAIVPTNQLLNTQVYALLAGPRYSHRFARMTPFVQFLAGAVYLERDLEAGLLPDVLRFNPFLQDAALLASGGNLTEAALQAGGGVDIRLTERLSARFAGDYRRIFGVDMNQIRFAAGVSVGIGRR